MQGAHLEEAVTFVWVVLQSDVIQCDRACLIQDGETRHDSRASKIYLVKEQAVHYLPWASHLSLKGHAAVPGCQTHKKEHRGPPPCPEASLTPPSQSRLHRKATQGVPVLR